MARIPRSITVLDGFSVHKVWRGHNREWNLETDEQKARYLELMNEDLESGKYEKGASLQALTLMSSHTHEINQVLKQKLFSEHMRRVHSRYGAFFNKLKDRCGKVAQDRPHTTLLADEEREMHTVMYAHANPIRAGIVNDAKDYKWSTHKLYAYGIREPWMRNIELPSWYMKLGKTDEQRQHKYRQLFEAYLKEFGLRKQSFLKKRFFGPISWVAERQKAVKDWRKRSKAPPPA